MKHKYNMLVETLDKIRLEAPSTYKTYRPSDENQNALDYSRSLAFIHLLLKVKFGKIDFLERHKLITDGSQDGGVDAYFIDSEQKKIYFIQSKFRTNHENFENKSMDSEDLIKMEITRITKGVREDSNEKEFNSKILNFQKEIQEIRDIAKYEYTVIFLGNLKKLNDEQIRKLIDNCVYKIYDSEAAYNELLFPLATGTYYDPNEITIRLLLTNKEHPRLKQAIETEFGSYYVTVVFVPIIEIAKVVSQYKNAILKYNPRNFLTLQKKSVNEKIKKSIVTQDKNSFALLNNGITIISDNVNFSDSTGKKNEGQLLLTKPQILNGGQTAFTICEIYENYLDKPHNPLNGKEVLIRIITPIDTSNAIDPKFIELISNATNQQNEVSEGDRRSNHIIQLELQKLFFNKFGYFYERKTGEFTEGKKNEIIRGDYIIDRFDFIKAYLAYLGESAAARRISEQDIFQEDSFYKILNDMNKHIAMFFAFLIFSKLQLKEKTFKKKSDSIDILGYSLMYGKWAVIASIGILNLNLPDNLNKLDELADQQITERLNRWKSFDKFIKEKNYGSKYFTKSGNSNYELYYKINSIDHDIREYFLQ